MASPQTRLSNSAQSPNYELKNKLINGNFDFWQRATTTSTTNAYCADRWKSSNNGSTFVTSQQSFTLGQSVVPNNPLYFHRTVVTSVAGASNFCNIQQPIESVRLLSGKTVTVSFWAKADASKNIAVEFTQIFGTGGSPSSLVSGIGVYTASLTTSWQKFQTTVTIPSVSGKTLGSNGDDNLQILFWFDAGSSFNSRTNSLGQQSGTFDIAQVQVEEGSAVTDFDLRHFAQELMLCQRYYQIGGGGGATGTTTSIDVIVEFVPQMRAAPTMSIVAGTNGGTVVNAAQSNITSVNNIWHSADKYGIGTRLNMSGTYSASNLPAWIYPGALGFDAEL